MRALIRMLAAAVALAMTPGTAFAVMGKTTTDVALRRAPTAQAELILNLSQGALVNVGGCLRGWCAVSWNEYGGYVRESALQFRSTPASGPPAIPVYPPYPYKAGHYPTADAYYDLPPYAATNPSFYRWRHFLTAQERNRYRYMPHIFRGYTGYRDDTVGSYVLEHGAGEQTNLTQFSADDRAQSAYARTKAPSARGITATRCTRTEPPSAKGITATRCTRTEPPSAKGITATRCTRTEPPSAKGITATRCTRTEPPSARGITSTRCARTEPPSAGGITPRTEPSSARRNTRRHRQRTTRRDQRLEHQTLNSRSTSL